MNITKQIREMIDQDPEGVNAISRRYGGEKHDLRNPPRCNLPES